jgi:UDP-glucose 4-epimerase
MRTLVTGGAGFVGSHLVDELMLRGDEVIVLDDLSTGTAANLPGAASGRVRLVTGNVVDDGLVRDLMSESDRCFHLAASVGVGLVVGDPIGALLNNVRGTDVILAAAADLGRPLLFASTSEIYGRAGRDLLREDSDRVLGGAESLRWTYATGKAFGEAAAQSYFQRRAADIRVARLFNAIGPRQSGTYGMVVPRLVAQALAGDDLTVYGHGRQQRCFTHVLDVVAALIAIMDAPGGVGAVLNVGATQPTTILGLARRIRQHVGSTSRITRVPFADVYGARFEEPASRRPDTTRLRALTGWVPQRTLDDAIADVVAERRGIGGDEAGSYVRAVATRFAASSAG